MICMTLLIPQSERASTPAASTGFIADVIDTFANTNTHTIPITPLPTSPHGTSFLLIFLGILAGIYSLLGDVAYEWIAEIVLFNGLLPLARTARRHVIAFGTRLYRRIRGLGVQADNIHQAVDETDESSRSPSSGVRAPTPDDSTDKVDTVEPQPSPVEVADNTPVPPPQNDQALTDLRAESQQKDAKIAELARSNGAKSRTITALDGQYSRLQERLRESLDPTSLYPHNTDVVTIANDMTRDLKRILKEIRKKERELKESEDREERGQLAEKDKEIAELRARNGRLDGRIQRLEERLEEGERSSDFAVQEHERRAQEKIRSLRERMLEAESAARQGISTRDFNTLRSQFDRVTANLRQARQEPQDAISAQEVLRAELEDERAQSQQLQTIVDNDAEAQRQRENAVTTESHDLQLANGRIASLEQEALTHGMEVQNAETRAQSAETRAQAAEDQATNDGTLLEQIQQDARDDANRSRESIKQLRQDLQKAKKALKEKAVVVKAKPEVVASRPDQDLVAETNNLRVLLDEATKRESEAFNNGFLQALAENPPSNQAEETTADAPSHPDQQDASTQTNAPADDPLYQQGRQEERRACEEQVQTLIDTAVRQARQEGEEALRAAVAQNEQALKASAEAAWASNEAQLRADFNAAAQSSASEEGSLREQLRTAVQRAIKAESSLSDTADSLKTEKNSFAEMQSNASKEWERAQKAEAEVEKYKKGKQSQDGRIQGYLDEINRLKRLIPQDADLAAAELNATMGDRARATALIDESLHRHYDHPTREVLQQLLDANASIMALKGLLKNPPVKATRKQLMRALMDAEVDKNLYMSLDFSLRQVLVKQCRAVNARLAELRTIILEGSEPDRATLLRVIYQDRGDEMAEWSDDDPEKEASSDEDDDDDAALRPRVPPPAGRQTRQPVSRRNRPQPQSQPQPQPPVPAPEAAAPTPSAQTSTPIFSFTAPRDGASGKIPKTPKPHNTVLEAD